MSNKVIVCTCLPTFKQYDPYWKTVDFDFEYLSDRVSEGVEYNEHSVHGKRQLVHTFNKAK